MALTIAQCFTGYIFTVKCYVLFGLFKFGLRLDLKVLAKASTSTSSIWPRLEVVSVSE